MPETKTLISDELKQRVEEYARDQNRKPSEVLEEAWKQYVEEQSWVKVLGYGPRRAREEGTTECDVDRAIAETRAEQRSR